MHDNAYSVRYTYFDVCKLLISIDNSTCLVIKHVEEFCPTVYKLTNTINLVNLNNGDVAIVIYHLGKVSIDIYNSDFHIYSKHICNDVLTMINSDTIDITHTVENNHPIFKLLGLDTFLNMFTVVDTTLLSFTATENATRNNNDIKRVNTYRDELLKDTCVDGLYYQVIYDNDYSHMTGNKTKCLNGYSELYRDIDINHFEDEDDSYCEDITGMLH